MSLKNITVLGSGIMGHGIAQVSAMAGYNVVLRDIEQKFLDKAMGKIKWSLDKLVSKEKISQTEADDIFYRQQISELLVSFIMYFKIVMNIGTFQERKKNRDKMRRMWARTS